jgi:hypothetical protein
MHFLLLLVTLVVGVPRTIHFRQFSISPSLSGVGSTDPFASNYGAGQFFLKYVHDYTAALAPGDAELVTFVPDGISWQPAAGCNVVSTIGQHGGCVNGSRIATMDAGTQLNPVWGFMYNSGPAFGPNFPDFYDFLTSPNGAGSQSGLELLQHILDSQGANVQIIPAVGSPRQSSGYLKKDGRVVGLSEICKSNYTWRFLPPNQQILDRTCSNLVGSAKRMTFVSAVSGLGPAVDVQKGLVTAFEYAINIDNYDAKTGGFFPLNGDTTLCVPGNPQPACSKINPGHLGLRYIHYPGWHQNWFVAWMYINKDVWLSEFTQAQRNAIMDAGMNAMRDAWETSSEGECFWLQKILDVNNGEVQLNLDATPKDCDPKTPGVQTCSADMKLTDWSCADLRAIQDASRQYLDSLAGTSPDQLDLALILDRYETFARDIGFVWKREQFPRGCNGDENLRPICDCCDCDDCDEVDKEHKERPEHHKKHHKKVWRWEGRGKVWRGKDKDHDHDDDNDDKDDHHDNDRDDGHHEEKHGDRDDDNNNEDRRW